MSDRAAEERQLYWREDRRDEKKGKPRDKGERRRAQDGKRLKVACLLPPSWHRAGGGVGAEPASIMIGRGGGVGGWGWLSGRCNPSSMLQKRDREREKIKLK